jgi:hypothetical protein
MRVTTILLDTERCSVSVCNGAQCRGDDLALKEVQCWHGPVLVIDRGEAQRLV